MQGLDILSLPPYIERRRVITRRKVEAVPNQSRAMFIVTKPYDRHPRGLAMSLPLEGFSRQLAGKGWNPGGSATG
jgi:hypothetical protein